MNDRLATKWKKKMERVGKKMLIAFDHLHDKQN